MLGDRVQLQQVALNLLMNAFEALEQDPAPVKRVMLRTATANGAVRVSVVDGGVGLTDEQLPRMFEPFYTTKPDGMGLGLAICQTIMNAHDGTVDVERNADRGTTFSFSLPVLSGEGGDGGNGVRHEGTKLNGDARRLSNRRPADRSLALRASVQSCSMKRLLLSSLLIDHASCFFPRLPYHRPECSHQCRRCGELRHPSMRALRGDRGRRHMIRSVA